MSLIYILFLLLLFLLFLLFLVPSPLPFTKGEGPGEGIGTTFLWRKREEGEISPESIALFRSLEPFLTMVYTYAVLCNRISHPIEVNIHRELEDISAKYGLSIQEQRVITARILGLSLKETANALNIREDSTKKLAQKAYRKCGCTNHVDFVAQFITPRMFPSAKPPQS